MAQGDFHGVTVRHGENQEEEEGEVEQEAERNKEEEKSNNNAHDHGWDEVKRHCEALSQCEGVNRWVQHIYRRRAVCSVLRGQLVCVRRAVHVVGRIGLNVGENVLEVVHNVP